METVVEIADAVRHRRKAARQVVERSLERIARLNGPLNAFVHVAAEQARREADAIDARLARGEDPGILSGVPFGVKDTHRCRGLPITYGSALFRDAAASEVDETFVARIRSAGAIPIGVTAMPEFGFDSSTRSRLWGTTRNPWNPERTPGGSSGGSAAAVSAGMVPFATAGDSSGSTRSPASFTGTVGMLASHGRVPNGDGFDDMTVNGVITTTVADTARLLDVMQGPDIHDRTSLPRYQGSFEDESTSASVFGMRAVFSPDFGSAVVDPEVVAIARRAADKLVNAGGLTWRERDVQFPDAKREWFRQTVHRIRVGLEVMGALPGRREELSEHLVRLTERFGQATEVELYKCKKAIPAIEAAAAELFESVDILLSPATACAAFPADWSLLDVRIGDASGLNSAEPFGFLANACWLPSISVPAGVTRAGLPVGLMITGRRFEDALVLRLARLCEQAMPWPLHAPGYPVHGA